MAREHISAEEFDRRFDAGEDISAHVDWAAARRPNRQMQRVNVDFPTWMVEALGTEKAPPPGRFFLSAYGSAPGPHAAVIHAGEGNRSAAALPPAPASGYANADRDPRVAAAWRNSGSTGSSAGPPL